MLIPFGVFSAAGAGGGGGGASSYELIESNVLGSNAASVTFSSIPSTYKHLQLRIVARGAIASSYEQLNMRFNSDTGTNYSWHWIYGDGSSVTSSTNGPNQSEMRIGQTAGNTTTANTFSAEIVDVLDYANASKYKTIKTLSGKPTTNNFIELNSGNWRSTSAVTSVTLFASGGNLLTGSRFSLYGIKG